ncbi:hypothetical protein M440DRAFT_1025047 [Trichoderma longibrachiatum ATCC 18648]|uniref:Uncharacterized protein n=1 Tax=Trichoderma longibrachiatum ATCC 18648 TaxID=983965 RepID=A0A2T4CJW6_TRILO|nr:hypothetical protein M440DRAFT_1025047 [Trichoderma longibrachiatum ATCC 18648]
MTRPSGREHRVAQSHRPAVTPGNYLHVSKGQPWSYSAESNPLHHQHPCPSVDLPREATPLSHRRFEGNTKLSHHTWTLQRGFCSAACDKSCFGKEGRRREFEKPARATRVDFAVSPDLNSHNTTTTARRFTSASGRWIDRPRLSNELPSRAKIAVLGRHSVCSLRGSIDDDMQRVGEATLFECCPPLFSRLYPYDMGRLWMRTR